MVAVTASEAAVVTSEEAMVRAALYTALEDAAVFAVAVVTLGEAGVPAVAMADLEKAAVWAEAVDWDLSVQALVAGAVMALEDVEVMDMVVLEAVV